MDEDTVLNVGLALKSIRTTRRQPFVVCYGSSDHLLNQGEIPLITHALSLLPVPPGATVTFAGDDRFGPFLFPPKPIERVFAWHLEVWESDDPNRPKGDLLANAQDQAHHGSSLVTALSNASTGGGFAVAVALSDIAGNIGQHLSQRGDELLLAWSGSIWADQLRPFAGITIERSNFRVHLELQLLGSEGPGPVEVRAEKHGLDDMDR